VEDIPKSYFLFSYSRQQQDDGTQELATLVMLDPLLNTSGNYVYRPLLQQLCLLSAEYEFHIIVGVNSDHFPT
jgi:hypothetical protein